MNGTPRATSASATGYTRSSRRLMSSTASSSRSPSASTRASASRTEPAGPTTSAPPPSSSRAREAAIRYSSSTTRRRRPRSASGRGSAMLRSCPARLDRHHDGAAHPVGAELEPRLRAELVRQRVLDQLGAEALPPWQGIPRHRHPALPPLDQHPAPGPLDGPGHHEPTRGPLERAVLDGVGRELVERERQRLGEARRQRDRRALDPHLAGIGAAVAVRLELGLDQGAQVDGLPVRAGEQPLHAAERLEPALELVAEPLERGAGAERLEGDRLHDGEQVAGPVVELGHEHPLLVLHAPEVVDVGHGADPFAPRPVAGVQRPGARLVPAVAAVRPAPDAVLDVVLARGRGLGPAPPPRRRGVPPGSPGWIASSQPSPRLSPKPIPVKSIHCGLGQVRAPSGLERKTSWGMLVASSRKRSSLSRSRSSARCRSVRSRTILTNPAALPSSGMRRPEAQNREPSLRTCQRSSSARPSARARRRSSSGAPATRSSGVKITSALRPMISPSTKPNRRSAPTFQLVTAWFGSVVKIAKSVALSTMRPNSSASPTALGPAGSSGPLLTHAGSSRSGRRPSRFPRTIRSVQKNSER